MHIFKRKTVATTLTALAILLLTTVTLVLPITFAQYTAMPDRLTGCTVGISPTLIGLGQSVVINVIVYPGPSGPTYEGQSLVPLLNAGYANVSVTITHPDGTSETFKPVDTTLAHQGIVEPGRMQIVGHLMFSYSPTKIGNYSVSASFPGQTYTTDIINKNMKLSVYYKPSSSPSPTTFTVQEQKVSAGILDGWPYSPLPQNYWSEPVQINNREWAAISGDWPQESYDMLGSSYNPYSKAPNSPHILWSMPVADSGLIGGTFGSLPYGESSSEYRARSGLTRGDETIIVDGKIYRNGRTGYFECIDMRTGQRLWEASGTINQAQREDVPFQTASQVNEGGIASWLWGGLTTSTTNTGSDKWYRYSTFNGDLLQTITNVPKDFTSIRMEDGDPIAWCVQANYNLWNTTIPGRIPYLNLVKWNFTKMINTVIYAQVFTNDWRNGIEWNVSAIQTPDLVSIGDSYFRGPTCMPFREANVVIVRNPNAMQIMAGYDYTTGAFLWKNNATVLNIDINIQGIATGSNGPHLMREAASNNYVAYNVKTGQEIWRASSGDLPWGMLPAYGYVYHNGTYFLGSYDAHVYAYQSTDGKQVWKSDFTGETWETMTGSQPYNAKAVGADGKLYFASTTEYQLMPRPRFQLIVCIDEATGKFKWVLPMGINPRGIADGYLLGEDIDNGLLYCIGKGKTATTVTAPDVAVPLGSTVLIKGTVMDQSPGKPNVPAVSDADMSMWMDYLYGQNATLLNNPPSPRGVEVTLSVLDSNNNIRNIGTATSNSDGFFTFNWTPDIEGQYTVYATFAGSESYWSSHAVTSFAVGPAEQAGQAPEVPQPIDNTMTIVGVGIAILIAIAIGFAIVVMMLRKRP